MSRKTIDTTILILLKNKEWLEDKLINQQYSCSRLAKELGTTRTTVEKYRVFHNIQITLSQKELTTINYQNKSKEEKEQILSKRKTTNKQLYGEENTFVSHKEKIIETMLEKYGVEKPLQSSDILKKQTQTMIKKYNRKSYSQQHLSLNVIDTLNDKEWLTNQHITQKKTIKQISQELVVDPTTVNFACQRNEIKIKYYYESAQQREISDWLSSLDILVNTNIRNIITGELDIYLPDYNLAVEYCGVFWHSDAHTRMTPNYHLNKLKQCQKLGIRLLTIYEDEWLYKKDIVKQKMLSILKMNTESIFARKCQIIQITNTKIKQQFLDQYHIQGTGPGSITYSLTYNDNIIAIMTFIQKPNGVYDLNRYATSTRIVGGFQKLLKHFQKKPYLESNFILC